MLATISLGCCMTNSFDIDSNENTAFRFRARVMYDGTDFRGMQIQPQVRSVAGELERTLSKRTGRHVRIVSASRTDTGVHARGQAVHFDLDEPTDPVSLQRSLNALLPSDIRMVQLEMAPERDEEGRPWSALWWATGKLYSYRIHCGGELDPLERRERVHVRSSLPIDIAAMREAAQYMCGIVDCAAFANRRADQEHPVLMDPAHTLRLVRSIDVVDEGDGRTRLDFHVQSALYKMVRNMCGLLLLIGRGQCNVDQVARLIASRNRDLLPPPAPAHGLTLESVYYCHGWNGAFDHPLHPDEPLPRYALIE